jgi:hypothetical protein
MLSAPSDNPSWERPPMALTRYRKKRAARIYPKDALAEEVKKVRTLKSYNVN